MYEQVAFYVLYSRALILPVQHGRWNDKIRTTMETLIDIWITFPVTIFVPGIHTVMVTLAQNCHYHLIPLKALGEEIIFGVFRDWADQPGVFSNERT